MNIRKQSMMRQIKRQSIVSNQSRQNTINTNNNWNHNNSSFKSEVKSHHNINNIELTQQEIAPARPTNPIPYPNSSKQIQGMTQGLDMQDNLNVQKSESVTPDKATGQKGEGLKQSPDSEAKTGGPAQKMISREDLSMLFGTNINMNNQSNQVRQRMMREKVKNNPNI